MTAHDQNTNEPNLQGGPQRELGPELLRRVRWRSRRGLLELDIVLGRFVDLHYVALTANERCAFELLLEMPDNVLWDMIAGREQSLEPDQMTLVRKIMAV
jgi:antitoxin CptB